MPKKLPYFPFYTGDWLKDDALTLCAPATRGVWIDLLARMHERDRSGELCGTADQLARAARCSTVEFVHAATDLQTTGTADVTERNGVWTVRNRRMWGESNARKSAAERQMRHRNACRDGPVTQGDGDSPEIEYEDAFETFWKEYPKLRRKNKARAREAFNTAIEKVDAATLIAAARDYAESAEGKGKWVKMPSTWLNSECWADNRESWRDLDKEEANPGQYRKVSSAEFKELYQQGQFRIGPTRHASDERWVYGTLKNNDRVECRTYPPRSQSAPSPVSGGSNSISEVQDGDC